MKMQVRMGNSVQPLSISIAIDTQPQSGVVDLVESTVFGTDGLQYQRQDVRSQLDRFNAPTYFHAMVDGDLVGVYVLDRRDLLVEGRAATGYYRGVLAVASSWQQRGVGKRMTAAAMTWLAHEAHDVPVVSYGCIDQANTRSLRLLQGAGATVGPALTMYMMYRQWPKVRCDLVAFNECEDLGESYSAPLNELAGIVYGDCNVRDVSPSRLKGFALHDENGLAISARVAPTRFRIIRMDAIAKWCTLLFVKPFSAARKRFDPDNFRYISFSNVLIRPGCEYLWPDFVSTVLARHNCHFGAIYVDPQSNFFTQLNKPFKIARLFHSSEGSIKVVWQGFGGDPTAFGSRDGSRSVLHVWPIDA